MTVELKREIEEREKTITPAEIARRVGSIRVRYGFVIVVMGWFTFALVIYVLRVLGFIDGR